MDPILRKERKGQVSLGLRTSSWTFVFVKPDGVRRGLVGSIIARFEAKELKLMALRIVTPNLTMARGLYSVHRNRPFFGELTKHVVSGPICAMVLRGKDAVLAVRNLVGATDPMKAAPGTIRGDFGTDITNNVVHASDSIEAARRELKVVFGTTIL